MFMLIIILVLVTMASGVHVAQQVTPSLGALLDTTPRMLITGAMDVLFSVATALSMWWRGGAAGGLEQDECERACGVPTDIKRVTVFSDEGDVMLEVPTADLTKPLEDEDETRHFLVRVDYSVGNHDYAIMRRDCTYREAYKAVLKRRYNRLLMRRGLVRNCLVASSYYPTPSATVNISDWMRKLQGPYCDFKDNSGVTLGEVVLGDGMCKGGLPEGATWAFFGRQHPDRGYPPAPQARGGQGGARCPA